MNTTTRVNLEILAEVLSILGYHMNGEREGEIHWRRRNFHLIVHVSAQTKGSCEVSARLTLHRDAHIPYPPGHKALFKGRCVEEEFNKILTAYKNRLRRDREG